MENKVLQPRQLVITGSRFGAGREEEPVQIIGVLEDMVAIAPEQFPLPRDRQFIFMWVSKGFNQQEPQLITVGVMVIIILMLPMDLRVGVQRIFPRYRGC